MPYRITFLALTQRLQQIFERAGCSTSVAAQLAHNCASAERDGARSHGVFRMPEYVSSLQGGWVDGHATPVVEDIAPSFARVDAMNGYAVPALAAVRALAIDKARRNGVSVTAIRNSHHLGMLSLDIEAFAEAGLIALSVVNSMKSVVPHRGKKPVFGTNPLAFAAPRTAGSPFLFDLATSAMAYGDVKMAARENHVLPPDVGVDRDGEPTTDPVQVIEGGALQTFGGHKGASISIMIEILCAALVGAQFSFECDLGTQPGAATPRTGQTLILINPRAGSEGLPDFGMRVEVLLQAIVTAGQDRLPGERRLSRRAQSMREGIVLADDEIAALDALEARLDG